MIINKLIDKFILLLCLFFLVVSAVNGYMLHNNIGLSISVGQLFSLVLIILILFSLFLKKQFQFLFFSIFLLVIFSIPSLLKISETNSSFLIHDFVKLIKYLSTIIYTYYFAYLLKNNQTDIHNNFLKIFKFSYFVLAVNILFKYVGLGYPMYKHGNIGSKGYFYAGNSISFLLVLLSSLIAFEFWRNKNYFKYFLFFLLSLFIGFTISSKTGIVGIILVFTLIPLKRPSFSFIQNRNILNIVPVLFLMPILFYIAWIYVSKSDIYMRISYFWQKLDLVTFLLSSRNNFFETAIEIYKNDYSILEKFIGVGPFHFEKYNNYKAIEMDFLDIFFSYGIMGLVFFFTTMFFLIFITYKNTKQPKFIYANFCFLMVLFFLVVSSLAGHIFGSGFTNIFLAIMFSLFIYNNEIKST